MELFVGLDVSMDETSICVVDRDGKIIKECKAATDPAAMRLLLIQRRNLKRKFLDLENTIRHSLKAFGIRFKGSAAAVSSRPFAKRSPAIR